MLFKLIENGELENIKKILEIVNDKEFFWKKIEYDGCLSHRGALVWAAQCNQFEICKYLYENNIFTDYYNRWNYETTWDHEKILYESVSGAAILNKNLEFLEWCFKNNINDYDQNLNGEAELEVVYNFIETDLDYFKLLIDLFVKCDKLEDLLLFDNNYYNRGNFKSQLYKYNHVKEYIINKYIEHSNIDNQELFNFIFNLSGNGDIHNKLLDLIIKNDKLYYIEINSLNEYDLNYLLSNINNLNISEDSIFKKLNDIEFIKILLKYKNKIYINEISLNNNIELHNKLIGKTLYDNNTKLLSLLKENEIVLHENV